jgi:hypothetical protein
LAIPTTINSTTHQDLTNENSLKAKIRYLRKLSPLKSDGEGIEGWEYGKNENILEGGIQTVPCAQVARLKLQRRK